MCSEEKIAELQIRMLIKNGANLDLMDMNGNTALMIAVRRCPKVEIIEMMFEKKPNIDLQNKYRDTALIIAMDHKKYEFAKMLIEYGANIGLADNNGNTALMIAAGTRWYGQVVGLVELMLQKNADLNINMQNNKQETALMIAIENGKLQIAQMLIEKGSSLDIMDKHGKTELMIAARRSKLAIFYVTCPFAELIDLMIKKNANVNVRNEKGETALIFALRRENYKLAELFIENGAKLETMVEDGTLMAAIRFCPRLDLIKKMFEKSLDVNLHNEHGERALMAALQNGNLDIAELLIERGVHIGSVDPYGNTSLIIATQHCPNVEIIRKIIEKNKNINSKNKNGETVLMIAFERKQIKIVQTLMEFDPNLDLRNKNGDTDLSSNLSVSSWSRY